MIFGEIVMNTILFFIMYTARYLGAEGFGISSFALAFTGIFGVFSDLGLRTLTVREVARDKLLASKYLRNIVLMNRTSVAFDEEENLCTKYLHSNYNITTIGV